MTTMTMNGLAQAYAEHLTRQADISNVRGRRASAAGCNPAAYDYSYERDGETVDETMWIAESLDGVIAGYTETGTIRFDDGTLTIEAREQ
ncbi:hypothetical protein [Actinobaculum sp. 352]|uniref:hypothetical protein n=1 Tax=Actinobaculum sp. 352 TaxID=2490946 RepID=UPI000F7E85AF|nr:hypothetical protein [Actinobaculum sp. 352]RTE49170.1 hypothetical protein EKN07_06200 [Actinobaculum sp. 352]